LLVVWTGFSFSSVSQPVLGGQKRSAKQLHSQTTPLEITAYLREHPPQGMVWAPVWWGDWIVWDGPKDVQVFATSKVHLAPRQVSIDLAQVQYARPGWERTLDRYRVETVVVHKATQPALAKAASRSSKWRRVYEDKLGIVFTRAS